MQDAVVMGSAIPTVGAEGPAQIVTSNGYDGLVGCDVPDNL